MRRRTIPAIFGLTAVAATGLTLAATSAGAMQSPSATKPIKVTVTATDFKYKFSQASVPKGVPIEFTLVNKGPSPHDIDFTDVSKKTAILNSSQKAVLKVTFKKAGKYRYICTVPRHAQFGMVGNYTVK